MLFRSVDGDGASANVTSGFGALMDLAAAPVTGNQVFPLGSACAILAIAAVAGVLGTKGWGRRIVGGVALAAGIALVAGPARVAAGFGWPAEIEESATQVRFAPIVIACAAGVAIVVGSSCVIRFGTRWPSLSSRYGRTQGAAMTGSEDPWEILDRGDDPTVTSDVTQGRINRFSVDSDGRPGG